MEMLNRMQTGRLKVAAHLSQWFEEFRMYHRKDGRIVKEYDDLLCATRYGLMMLKHARTMPDHSQSRVRMADGVDYDLLDPHGSQSRQSSSGVVWGNGRPAHMDRNTSQPRSGMAGGADHDIFS